MDQAVLDTVQQLLDLTDANMQDATVIDQLRAPLRYGGFGLTSARNSSPISYLASVACSIDAPALMEYASTPLPATRSGLMLSPLAFNQEGSFLASPPA